MSRQAIVKTARHEMERRIRFGSDGNGIFVAVSMDGGKTWKHFDRGDYAYKVCAVAAGLPADEYAAGLGYLADTWKEYGRLPRTEYVVHFYHATQGDVGRFEDCKHAQRETLIARISELCREWSKRAVVFLCTKKGEEWVVGEEVARVTAAGRVTVSADTETAGARS